MKPRIALLLALCLTAQPALVSVTHAETEYVTDSLEITLRAGESTRYRIIRMLPSGTPLEVLSVNPSTDYARVRTQDGTVGFVLERELQKEPTARMRLTEMEKRLSELQAEPDALTARLASMQTDYAELDAAFQSLQREKTRIEEELATLRHASSNILDITNARDLLRIQVSELTRDRADLEQQVRDLTHQTNQRWFIIGAGVMIIGVLVGLVLPHLRLQRRRGHWESL